MAAYVIATVTVTDRQRYAEYVARTPATIAAFGGRFLARGGDVAAFEGDAPAGRIVLIEFPSLEAARAWYDSDAYREARQFRQGAATGSLIAVDGV